MSKQSNKKTRLVIHICTGRKNVVRLITVLNGSIKNFHWLLTEKLLATRQGQAIFAIPKNDVETPHFEGRIGSSVG